MLTLGIQLPLALGIALLLNQRFRGRAVFRVLFFAPFVLPEVIAGVLFTMVFSPNRGLANHLLGLVGLEKLGRDLARRPADRAVLAVLRVHQPVRPAVTVDSVELHRHPGVGRVLASAVEQHVHRGRQYLRGGRRGRHGGLRLRPFSPSAAGSSSLEESATLDGCGPFGFFWRIAPHGPGRLAYVFLAMFPALAFYAVAERQLGRRPRFRCRQG